MNTNKAISLAELKNLLTANQSNLKVIDIRSTEEYNKLQNDSLLRVQISANQDTTRFFSTQTGAKLHKALIQAMYSQIIK